MCPQHYASEVEYEFDWMKVIIFENDLASRDELAKCITDRGVKFSSAGNRLNCLHRSKSIQHRSSS